ncbi:serine-protein kinase ATM-like isoform X2 [Saccostrea cucullata]|uniref:serine-protein kinase ATM-like isoform X2 n=1 Tax=Saccostrea cuccullata TaxID=36930 RepID=UPI002ED4EE35
MDQRLHEKRRVLQMYCLVCRLLLQDFDGGLGGCFVYIFREILYRLVYLIQEMRKQECIRNEDGYANNISCMALELLCDVLERTTSVAVQEVEKYLKFVINSLVPVTTLSPVLCEKVKKVFKMLLIDNKKNLMSGIASLDPFPDREEFYPFTAVKNDVKLLKGPTTLRQPKALCEELPEMNYNESLGAINQDELWWETAVSHEFWIIRLTSAILTSGAVNNNLLCCLKPLCLLRSEVCEFLLPILVYDVLSMDNAAQKEILSQQISKFFLQHCRLSSTKSQSGQESSSICHNKDSVRTMLRVVHYLRQQPRNQHGRSSLTVWDNNYWLDINYLHIAKAALSCSAHFSTVFYAEIWCNYQRIKQEEALKKSSSLSEVVSQSFTQDSQVDSLSSVSGEVTLNVQDLLLEAYRQIGDPDGVYGCGAGRLPDPVSRIRMYEHEGQWEKAVITYDIGLQQHSQQEVDLLKALDSFGSKNLLDSYLENYPNPKSGAIRNLIFKSAIKVGKWDLNMDESSECSFDEAVHRSLCTLKHSQFSIVSTALDMARKNALDRLRDASMESCRCLYPILSDLQCIYQIDQAVRAITGQESKPLEDMLTKWTQERPSFNEFEYIEPIHTTRLSVLQVLPIQTDAVQVCMQKELLCLTRLAIQNRRYLVAEGVVSKLKSCEASDFQMQVDKLTEEAKLFWSRGEQNIAKHLTKKILKMLEQKQESNLEAAKLYPRVLSMYGNWAAETNLEDPNTIMEEYLEKTVSLLESLEEKGDTILDAYLSLARFADGQYQHIVNYMKSSTFEAKQNLMTKAKKEITRMQQLGMDNLEKDRYYRTLSKQSEIDQSELNAMEEDRWRCLKQAVQNYIKCLKHGDKHDIRIFRLVSLWFSNPTYADISGLIMINMDNIKSYKFLSLMYQLCARMDTNPPADQSPSLQKTLQKIIHHTAVDHPHHTLFCIFALVNAKRDSELLRRNAGSKSRLAKNSQTSDSENQGRIEAAKKLITQLKSDKQIGGIVKNMEVLCDAFIQLANFNVSQYSRETKPITLDKRLWITQLKEMDNVAVPTDEIPIDPTGEYKSVVTLKGFEPTFKLAGGINLPKILTCLGSDGRRRRQLVKGRDDLRQDAIMQQVFGMLNTLFHKNPDTRKRNLMVKQYKVIPLSQCSGVLEWCEGTLPIGMYLIGERDESKGAHKRFRPQDITARACRDKMVETVRASLNDKLKNFLGICSRFQPVLRYFFLEKFSQPSVWFERRLAYTRSVSTTSIVGYILGLGDRHIQNILIDTNSAELVHIDLGIAFEQGRILPTPETVPFRLTRDIIDGMGVCGVEGTFRRCCEKTMDVMHNNQEALLTILEVLLYDPLNNWTISPQKAAALQSLRDRMDTETSELNATKSSLVDIDAVNASVQQESQESVNKLAERVLLHLQRKLQGYVEGVQFSVAGQVNNLIQEARDPKNLCRLFPGWQPYI